MYKVADMPKVVTTDRLKIPGWVIMMFSTLLITIFLFFIHEGYYDFRWLHNPGNWIVFPVYALPIFTLQLLFEEIVFKNYRGPGKTALSIAGGTLTGFLLVAGLIFV